MPKAIIKKLEEPMISITNSVDDIKQDIIEIDNNIEEINKKLKLELYTMENHINYEVTRLENRIKETSRRNLLYFSIIELLNIAAIIYLIYR